MSRIHRRCRCLLGFLSRIGIILSNTQRKCTRMNEQGGNNTNNKCGNQFNDFNPLSSCNFHNFFFRRTKLIKNNWN